MSCKFLAVVTALAFTGGACKTRNHNTQVQQTWQTVGPRRPHATVQTLTTVGYQTEQALKETTAEVAIADYILLKQDFPNILDGKSDQEIDTWLKDTVGIVSEAQANLGEARGLNDRMVTGAVKPAIRPESYGRALVVEVPGTALPGNNDNALIEVKGAGSKDPERGSHQTGYTFFSEALREYHYDKLVTLVARHAQVDWATAPVYAVLALGHNAIDGKNRKRPAGLIIRQSHVRYRPGEINPGGFPIYSPENGMFARVKNVEGILRKYGLSAGKDSGDQGFWINLQFTQNFDVIDFGAYQVKQSFRGNALFASPYLLEPLSKQEKADLQGTHFAKESIYSRINPLTVLAQPESEPDYVSSPHAELRAPLTRWGEVEEALRSDFYLDVPDYLAFYHGLRLAAGKAAPKDALKQHCLLVVPVARRLGFAPDSHSSTAPCSTLTLDYSDKAFHSYLYEMKKGIPVPTAIPSR